MAALSDYLESKILNHIFRSSYFEKPSGLAIALTSGVALDYQDGSSIPELPLTISDGTNDISTNYARIDLGSPSGVGNSVWNEVGLDNSTIFYVESREVGSSGYYYPLYLSQSEAASADQANGANPYFGDLVEFSGLFPGISFYAPRSMYNPSGDLTGFTLDCDAGTPPPYIKYEGNGFIKNTDQLIFNTALTDWGPVSGVAILDSPLYGEGNLLMYAQLNNPRIIYIGDSIRFDPNSFEISLN